MKYKEALFYKKLRTKNKEKIVQCQLCPHFCILKDGERGKCRVRENQRGTLVSLVYNHPCSIAIDPIEKKPLYHFFPGEKAFSIATVGCNLSCKQCQNWQISQAEFKDIKVKETSPEQMIRQLKESGCKIIAYTYTEPTVFYEYMIDIAKLAKKQGFYNVVVSNGFINPKPLKQLLNYVDAFNIDLKAFDDKFYREICGGRLTPVLETLKIIHKAKKHLEITNLLITGLNDKPKQIENLVLWVKKNLNSEVPLHFSAFYPCYKLLNISPTSPERVINAQKIGKKLGMKNVYTGNI